MKYTKMHGAGNDFIIINNIEEKIPIKEFSNIAKKLCQRKMSIGADGFMVVEKPEKGGDFKMLFYNSDGSIGEMCGNGARCIARYGFDNKFSEVLLNIETASGIVIAEKIDEEYYKIKLGEIKKCDLNEKYEVEEKIIEGSYVELGNPPLPHLVVNYDNLGFLKTEIEITNEFKNIAEKLRHHENLDKGANVNFYHIENKQEIQLITFERGVEDFTLACGTGASSTVVALNRLGLVNKNNVKVKMPGGILTIDIGNDGEVFLTGPTVYVSSGEVLDEKLKVPKIYNFDITVDRRGTFSAKFDEKINKFGTDDVIPMWIADMDFRTADEVIDACVKRAEHGIFGYVSKPLSYKAAAKRFMKRRHNWDIDIDTMSFSVGIVPAISELVREFTVVGDKVLIQTPVYPEFYEVVEAWDGRIVIESELINENGHYRIDFEDFEEKLKQKPKLFILCNPHNPVGRVWSKEELTKLHKLCLKYGVAVISDEIHGSLELFDNKYTPSCVLSEEIKNNTIACFSATKAFNLAGLQACMIVFNNKDWKLKFDNFWKGLDIHRNNCFSLVAMEAAWNYGDNWLDQVRKYIQDNMLFAKEYIDNNIKDIKFVMPESTYLAWLDFSSLKMSPEELDKFLIFKAKVGLNNGNDFCRSLNGFMRMNMATQRSNVIKALENIKVALENMN